MSHESMIENIKANLDHVDPAALQSIWEIVNQSKPKPVLSPKSTGRSTFRRAAAEEKPAKFVGENLTLDEYERLSPKERGMLQRRLKEQNHLWLKNKFSELKAAWLVVVDGEVIDWGKSLKNLPLAKQNVEVSHHTGKFPFVFINDDLMAIEESKSAWHATNDPGDYYEISRHLNQPYHGVAKSLRFQLSSKAGEAFAFETMIYCVPDWHISPFVKINPDRVALVGRDLLLTLKPKVLLDFERRRTEILDSIATKPAIKKTGARKKQARRPRRRS